MQPILLGIQPLLLRCAFVAVVDELHSAATATADSVAAPGGAFVAVLP
jgi:hypothetical protein